MLSKRTHDLFLKLDRKEFINSMKMRLIPFSLIMAKMNKGNLYINFNSFMREKFEQWLCLSCRLFEADSINNSECYL